MARAQPRHCRARTLFEIGTEAVWAQEPADLSLLHVLFYTHSAGGLDALLGTSGGAQQDRFVGGSQLVALRVAEALGDERLALAAPVRRIAHGADGVTVTADGVEVRARRAIVALPPSLAGRIAYDPPLPGYRDQLTQRMAQGSVIKCMAIYPAPFWRADGLSGQAASDVGPVRVTFDNSPPDATPGVLLGFLEGRQARALAGARPRSAATPSSAASRGFSARAPRRRRATSSAYGPTRSGPGAAMAVPCPRAPGPNSAPRCERRSAPALGRGRNRDGVEWVYGWCRLIGRACCGGHRCRARCLTSAECPSVVEFLEEAFIQS